MERRVITGLLISIFVFVGLFGFVPKKTEAQVDVAAACFQAQATQTAGSTAMMAAAGIGGIVAVAVAQNQAEAALTGRQLGSDEAQAQKEGCLDAIFYYIAKIIIHKIAQSTIAWINGGFQGSPSFIDNPGEFFGDVVNEELLDFIETVFPNTGPFIDFLCTPQQFQFDLKMKFLLKFGIQTPDADKPGCTLTDIGENVDGFIGSFSDSVQRFYDGNFLHGGWQRWFEVTQNTSNNPFALEYDIESKFIENVAAQLGLEKTVADWGEGFKSLTDEFASDAGSTIKKITMPGKFIEGQLEQVFGSPIRQLELADEFNEVVAALFSQLLTQVFNPNGNKKGLTGLSMSNTSQVDGNTGSYADDLYGNTAANQHNQGEFINAQGSFNAQSGNTLPDGLSGTIPTIEPTTTTQPVDPDKNIVYGTGPSHIFLGNPVGANESYGQYSHPSTLVDGNFSSGAEWFSVITDRGLHRFIQVELDRIYDISRIEVYERPGTASAMTKFWVYVSDTKITATTPQAINAMPGVQSHLVTVAAGNNNKWTIEGPFRGKYIMIMRAETDYTVISFNRSRLELAELMAFEIVPATQPL